MKDNNKEVCKKYYYAHREERIAHQKEYALAHKEHIVEYKKQWRQSSRGKELTAKWREDNREHLREGQKIRNANVKYEVLSHYSVEDIPICELCLAKGVRCVDTRLLTIDHINGGGTEHRKEVGAGARFYRWLKRNNYPEGYRVLCFGCNLYYRVKGE